MTRFARPLFLLTFLLVFMFPAWAQDLSDIIIVGYDAQATPNNPVQIRADRDGNILWQKPVPLLQSGGDPHRYGSRNQTEDALYLSSYHELDQTGGLNRLLKLDANGELVWKIPFSAHPIYLSANPVDGGVYALEYPPGNRLNKLDTNGDVIWAQNGEAFYGLSNDPATGGVFVSTAAEVRKLASDGSVVWTRPYPTIPYKLHANPVDGGVYVGYYDYGRNTDRLDGDGNLVWTKVNYPSSWTYGRSVSPLDGSLFIGSGWAGRIARVLMDGTEVFNIASNEAYLPHISAAIDEMAAYTGDYAQHGVTKHAGDGTVIWQKLYGPASWVGRYGVMNVYTGMPAIFTDTDGDGVPDDVDICAGGDDNNDVDGDFVPDYCDPCPLDAENDADGDNVCGDVDVCEGGNDNENSDGDALPDFCDVCPLDDLNDADGDGWCESDDNCEVTYNPDQTDTDGDMLGDACDPDQDGDGVLNAVDNCPFDVNPNQDDFDHDGAGDDCDSDDDGDGVTDADDQCLTTMPGDAINTSGCSIAELCPCDHPSSGSTWKNHGAYVRCVAHTSSDFVKAGLISEAEKDAIVSAAGQSACGHKN